MLTDVAIKTMKPGPKPIKRADGGGLFILVTPDGRKGWRLAYRLDGKQKLLSGGPYPKVGLRAARTWRDRVRAQLTLGIDPSAARREAAVQREAAAKVPLSSRFAVTTHLNFDGQARAALDFYKQVFGGERVLMTYGAMGQADAANSPNHIIWGQVEADDGFRIMAYDVQADRAYDAGNNAFYVSLRGEGAASVQARWDALTDGATIRQPIGPAPWSELYGMLTDRFGVTWIIDVAPKGQH